jgi:chemotaxis protein MotB
LANNASQWQSEAKDAQKRNEYLQTLNRDLILQNNAIADSLKQAQQLFQSGNKRYNELMNVQNALQKGNQLENQKLLERLMKEQANLKQKEDMLAQMEASVNDRNAAAARLEQELAERNKKILNLQNAIARKDSATSAIRKKVANALMGYEGKGLSVKQKNGKVYVSLDEKLLFASGSFQVEKRGKEAIRTLAQVLEKNTDINVSIEGHTDDVAYAGSGNLIDNWDLSVKRSTSVIRILLEGSSIHPTRITASGRAQYDPVNKAKTASARQQNRRIEIILTPRLDEILKLLEN